LSDPHDFRKLQFVSPEAVSRSWLEWFSEEFGREHFKFDMQPAADAPFRLKGINRALADFSVYHGWSSPVRSRSIGERDDDDPVISVGLAGAMSLHVNNSDIVLRPGMAIPLRNGVAGEFALHSNSEFFTIRLNRRLLEPLVPNLRDLEFRPIAADTLQMRLLLGYLRMLDEEQTITSPEVQHMVTMHTHDLAAMVFRAIQGAEGIQETGGVRAGRLATVKADILSHLADPQLSVATVAARLGLTPRYLHMLFENDEATFSEYVTAQRLTRAYRMLADLGSTRKISEIAMDVGFGDLSYFNRTFRRRFGATPSELREALHPGARVPAGRRGSPLK
jgi:AraC-like DNA-binding protein